MFVDLEAELNGQREECCGHVDGFRHTLRFGKRALGRRGCSWVRGEDVAFWLVLLNGFEELAGVGYECLSYIKTTRILRYNPGTAARCVETRMEKGTRGLSEGRELEKDRLASGTICKAHKPRRRAEAETKLIPT